MSKKVSLCMIVKNEEKNLYRCLNSARAVVDEMIIVDTGSTDKTKEIALKFGAKIIDFEWCDDFAKARNVGIDQATGDWILVLDADEEIVKGTKADFEELINVPIDNKNICYMVRFLNTLDGVGQIEHHMARLFVNKPDIRYKSSIHEYITSEESKVLQIPTDRVVLKHWGYSSAGSEGKDKVNRNLALLKKEAEKNPGDSFYQYHLAVTYQVGGMQEESIQAYERWADLVVNDNSDVSMGFAAYIGCLLRGDREKDALRVGEEVFKRCRHNPDFVLNMACVYEAVGDYQKALDILKLIDEIKKHPYPSLSYDSASLTWKPKFFAGSIYYNHFDDFEKAKDLWIEGLVMEPRAPEILRALYNAYAQRQEFKMSEIYLNKLIQSGLNNSGDVLNLGNIYINTDRMEQALEIYQQFDNREELINQVLSFFISRSQFDKVAKVNEFLKKKAS